jgi:hypothetical protein
MKLTFQEFRIIATGPCIANQLRDVHTICRRSWYIAAHVWKIYDFKIEVVPFIVNFSTEWTTVVKFEVYVQKWCGRSCICGLFNFQLRMKYQRMKTKEAVSAKGNVKVNMINITTIISALNQMYNMKRCCWFVVTTGEI